MYGQRCVCVKRPCVCCASHVEAYVCLVRLLLRAGMEGDAVAGDGQNAASVEIR